jgi:O-antigen/teichoic acid export membrane protein
VRWANASIGGSLRKDKRHQVLKEQREDVLRLARGGLLNLAGAASFGLLGLVLTVVVSRALSSDGTGVFFELVAVYTIGATLSNLGTSVGLMRGVARARALGREHEIRPLLVVALVPTAVASCLVAIVIVVFAAHLAELLFDEARENIGATYLRVAAPTLPFAAVLMGVLAATRGFGTMIPFNLVESFGQPALRLALAAGLFLGLPSNWYPALIWAAPPVLGLLIALPLLRSLLPAPDDRSHDDFSPTPVGREFWRFTSVRFGAATLEVILAWLGVLFLGALSSAEDAGVYAAASRYLVAGLLINAAVIGVIGPQLGELLAVGHRERVGSVYQTATLWLILVTFPIYLLIASFAPLLMRAFGAGFEEGANSLVVLGLGMLPSMAAGPIMALLLMGGKSSWNLLDTALAVVVNAVLNVILIPSFGPTGAAVAWAVTVLVLNGLPVFQAASLWGVHPAGPHYIEALAAATGCFAIVPLVVRVAFGASTTASASAVLAASVIYLAYISVRREELRLPRLKELGGGVYDDHRVGAAVRARSPALDEAIPPRTSTRGAEDG